MYPRSYFFKLELETACVYLFPSLSESGQNLFFFKFTNLLIIWFYIHVNSYLVSGSRDPGERQAESAPHPLVLSVGKKGSGLEGLITFCVTLTFFFNLGGGVPDSSQKI